MHHGEHSTIVSAIVHLLVTGLSVLIVGAVMPGMRVRSYGSAVWFALVVGVLNALVWYLLAPLSYGFAFLTAGIGALILNGIIFLVADKFSSGVEISGCFVAALASLAVSFVNWLLHFVTGRFGF
jgi:putative membrane protein